MKFVYQHCIQCDEVTGHYMQRSDCGEIELGLACSSCSYRKAKEAMKDVFDKHVPYDFEKGDHR